MKVKEIFDGFETYIEFEIENDIKREIFHDKCGKVYLIQFVNNYKIILKEINEEDENV